MPTKVIMPQLGESVVEGTVGRWLIQEGQPVKEYEPLLAVTTDKVDTEIPAPATGVLLKILRRRGPDGGGGHAAGGDRDGRAKARRGQTEPAKRPRLGSRGRAAAAPGELHLPQGGKLHPAGPAHGRRTRPRPGPGARHRAGRPGDQGGCGGIPGRHRRRGRARHGTGRGGARSSALSRPQWAAWPRRWAWTCRR